MVYYIRSHGRDEKVVPTFHVTWYFNEEVEECQSSIYFFQATAWEGQVEILARFPRRERPGQPENCLRHRGTWWALK